MAEVSGAHTAAHADHGDRVAQARARQARRWEEAAATTATRPRPDRAQPPDPRPTYDDHAAWEAALAAPCPAGHADAGEPCWAAPRGMCAARTGAHGQPTSRRRKK